MKSIIADAINLRTQPVALIWTDVQPEGAAQFKPQTWGCVVSLFAAAAARGTVGAFERQTYGCWGGAVGLGFGNQYVAFPGGVDCFCRFLATGNEESEQGRQVGEQIRSQGFARMSEDFLRGERYVQSPEATKKFVDSLPVREILSRFVVVKPLNEVDPDHDDVKSITFFVDPDGLSAMVTLASHRRPEAENVIVPWAAGCQVLGILAYRELEREQPRGLIGMMDISARKNVRATLGEHALSFTAPWLLFQTMENDVEGSFLRRPTWIALQQSKA